MTSPLDPDPLPFDADRPGPVPSMTGFTCGKGHGHGTQAGADLCDETAAEAAQDERIAAAVAGWPPLTDEQRERLRQILRPGQ